MSKTESKPEVAKEKEQFETVETTFDTKLNIWQRLLNVRRKACFIKKEIVGVNLKFKAVSVDMALAAVNGEINKNNLFLHTEILEEETIETTAKKMYNGVESEYLSYRTKLKLKYTWFNVDKPDENVSSFWTCVAVNTDPAKANGACLSYSEKYFMLKFFNIISSENEKLDPDYYNAQFEEEKRIHAIQTEIKTAIDCLYKLKSSEDLKIFREANMQYETKGTEYCSKQYIQALSLVHKKLGGEVEKPDYLKVVFEQIEECKNSEQLKDIKHSYPDEYNKESDKFNREFFNAINKKYKELEAKNKEVPVNA